MRAVVGESSSFAERSVIAWRNGWSTVYWVLINSQSSLTSSRDLSLATCFLVKYCPNRSGVPMIILMMSWCMTSLSISRWVLFHRTLTSSTSSVWFWSLCRRKNSFTAAWLWTKSTIVRTWLTVLWACAIHYRCRLYFRSFSWQGI